MPPRRPRPSPGARRRWWNRITPESEALEDPVEDDPIELSPSPSEEASATPSISTTPTPSPAALTGTREHKMILPNDLKAGSEILVTVNWDDGRITISTIKAGNNKKVLVSVDVADTFIF
jgi:hypothetical protein